MASYFGYRYDPFQVFEVHHKPCRVLKVTVLEGRMITKGWTADLFDTPDPYIQLDMPSAPSGNRKTKHLDNQVYPQWNETFQFLYDPEQSNVMRISLIDANFTYDEELAHINFNVGMLPLNIAIKGTFYFNDTSQVDIVFLSFVDTRPILRFSLSLCDEEKAFRTARRNKIYEAMQQILGEDGPRDVSEVPTIAVIGSGGGFRAMTGLSGAFTALHDSQILDMCTYVAGLSGSSWYISQLYSHPDWPEKSPGVLQKELRANVTSSWVSNLFSASSMYRYVSNIVEKRRTGQPVSFTDFFGWLVGETLLPKRLDSKLTDQRAKVNDGNIPMPLYTCLHVKKHVSAMIFHEWVEFTPYEIGMPKYGTFMKSELFGSKFYRGQLVKQHAEQPLHFLQGVWGSAFTILGSRLFSDNSHMDITEMMRLENREVLEEQLKNNLIEQDSEDSETSDTESSDEGDENKQEQQESKAEEQAAQGKVIIEKSKKEYKKEGFWNSMLESVCNSWLKTREGRAGMVHNFMRGLSLNHVYPYSPFDISMSQESDETFDEIFEAYPTDMKKLYMVDGGLTFNSPFPLLLRPQRAVDLIISFDFSARPKEISQPFEELKLAEKWAKINHVPFPEIDVRVYDREGMKECYIFEDPDDPNCPVIMHIVLANLLFRKFKTPGVPRETPAEKNFAHFNVFDDPDCPYSTFNFTYTQKSFDRLTALMEFNTLLNTDRIKETIIKCIRRKRVYRPRRPIRLKDIKMLLHVTRHARQQLKSYCTSFQSATDSDDENEADVDDNEDESDTEEEEEQEPVIEDVFGSFKRSNSVDPWSIVFGDQEQDHSTKRGFSFKDIVTMARDVTDGDTHNEMGDEHTKGDSETGFSNMPNGRILSKENMETNNCEESNQNQNNSHDKEREFHPVKRGLSVTFADIPNKTHKGEDYLDDVSESNGFESPSESYHRQKVSLADTREQSESWGQSFSSIGPEFSDCDSDDETDQPIDGLIENVSDDLLPIRESPDHAVETTGVDVKDVPQNHDEPPQNHS